jgi:hypothetical protein
MPVMTEGQHTGEFIVSEGNGSISRETATILNGRTLDAGAVLGQITASGKYREIDPAAITGAEVAVAVLLDAVDASGGDAPGIIISRLAEVHSGEVVWPTGITDPQKQTAIDQLAVATIIVR